MYMTHVCTCTCTYWCKYLCTYTCTSHYAIIEEDGGSAVLVSGARGKPAPDHYKVHKQHCTVYLGRKTRYG